MGIAVHVLPPRDKAKVSVTTSFKNVYDFLGRRTQYCPAQQEHITEDDLVNFPQISQAATILVAPVVGEVAPELFGLLSSKGDMAVTPQGYFRAFAQDGKVSQKPLENIEFFKFAKEVILSEEDLGFDDGTFFSKLKNVCQLLIQTHGENGSTLYKTGQEVLRIPAYPLAPSEIVDYTGAGDSYATAFLVRKGEGASDEEAGYFASFYAALKIAGLGGKGKGLVTIPIKEQVEDYTAAHKEKVQAFHVFF
jgi:hypothetical protein